MSNSRLRMCTMGARSDCPASAQSARRGNFRLGLCFRVVSSLSTEHGFDYRRLPGVRFVRQADAPDRNPTGVKGARIWAYLTKSRTMWGRLSCSMIYVV